MKGKALNLQNKNVILPFWFYLIIFVILYIFFFILTWMSYPNKPALLDLKLYLYLHCAKLSKRLVLQVWKWISLSFSHTHTHTHCCWRHKHVKAYFCFYMCNQNQIQWFISIWSKRLLLWLALFHQERLLIKMMTILLILFLIWCIFSQITGRIFLFIYVIVYPSSP